MKRLRLARWSGQCQSPSTRLPCRRQRALNLRCQSTASNFAPSSVDNPTAPSTSSPSLQDEVLRDSSSSPSPLIPTSAKLAALHARLALPQELPLSTLALSLRDRSAYEAPLNNDPLAELGNNIMAYYLTEHLIAHYPRLPMTVIFAAMFAYIGPPALTSLVREWGVEPAAAPGPEVDPGLLQLVRIPPGTPSPSTSPTQGPNRPNASRGWRRGVSSRIIYDDEFGDGLPSPPSAPVSSGTTLERASTSFARAVLGAVQAHAGARAAKTFFHAHALSRQLSLSSLFEFRQPTRDLSRLCAREGFEGPVARLLSETGRHSRAPVFVVAVYSGRDKLGEGAGASLDEARTRAAVAALKGWYLYSPLDVRLPSEVEDLGGGAGQAAKPWKPLMIDGGEVVV